MTKTFRIRYEIEPDTGLLSKSFESFDAADKEAARLNSLDLEGEPHVTISYFAVVEEKQ